MKCKCGCDQEFQPSKATLFRIKRGDEVGYIRGHWLRRENNPRWLGGRFVSANGYVYLLRPDHPNALQHGTPGYIAEHRLVMSERIDRPLNSNEVVHHINGDRQDNRIENLVLMTNAEHAPIHTTGENNGNWKGGRTPIVCATCNQEFLPNDRRNDYGATYCSRKCFYNRHK